MPARLEAFVLSKPAIGRLFKVAVAFVLAGAVAGSAVVVWALASGAVRVGGPQWISIDPGPVAGALAGLILASALAVAGTGAALASWVAALANTARLQDKSWFLALLALGVTSLGWVAMVAYLAAGPDSTRATARSAS